MSLIVIPYDLETIFDLNINNSNDEESIESIESIKSMVNLLGIFSLFSLTTFVTYLFCVCKDYKKNTQYKYTVIDDSSKIDV